MMLQPVTHIVGFIEECRKQEHKFVTPAKLSVFVHVVV